MAINGLTNVQLHKSYQQIVQLHLGIIITIESLYYYYYYVPIEGSQYVALCSQYVALPNYVCIYICIL